MTRKEALSRLETLPGMVGFYMKNLADGETVEYHADEAVEAASLIKLMVMAEAYRQREAGLIDFNERCVICPEDKLPSCGALTYMHPGLEVCVGDLVTLMIILSDNTAANLMIRRLGMDNINDEIRRLGLSSGTHLARLLFSPEKAQGIENHVTARDMGLVFEKLAAGEVVSPAASAEMLQMLKKRMPQSKEWPVYLFAPLALVGYHLIGAEGMLIPADEYVMLRKIIRPSTIYRIITIQNNKSRC